MFNAVREAFTCPLCTWLRQSKQELFFFLPIFTFPDYTPGVDYDPENMVMSCRKKLTSQRFSEATVEPPMRFPGFYVCERQSRKMPTGTWVFSVCRVCLPGCSVQKLPSGTASETRLTALLILPFLPRLSVRRSSSVVLTGWLDLVLDLAGIDA